MAINRELVTNETLGRAIDFLIRNLTRRLEKHGDKAFVGKHEILGILTEEFIEVGEAVHSKDMNRILKEVSDLGVACLWGIASLMQMATEKSDVGADADEGDPSIERARYWSRVIPSNEEGNSA